MRIYADTSVFGGCFDEEFMAESLQFFDLVRNGRVTLLLSDLVVAELEDAPPIVRQIVPSLPGEFVEDVPLTAAVLDLRDAYLAAGIVGANWFDDAGHVAAATVAGADAIISWNFKHIVHLDKIKGYNKVSRTRGYSDLTIITPLEVVSGDSQSA